MSRPGPVRIDNPPGETDTNTDAGVVEARSTSYHEALPDHNKPVRSNSMRRVSEFSAEVQMRLQK